jgi:hypothetical protein
MISSVLKSAIACLIVLTAGCRAVHRHSTAGCIPWTKKSVVGLELKSTEPHDDFWCSFNEDGGFPFTAGRLFPLAEWSIKSGVLHAASYEWTLIERTSSSIKVKNQYDEVSSFQIIQDAVAFR